MELNDDGLTLDEYRDEFREEYCSDCGCIADDEICPRCQAEIADAQRRMPSYRGDRRWNGQIMSRYHSGIDFQLLADMRDS